MARRSALLILTALLAIALPSSARTTSTCVIADPRGDVEFVAPTFATGQHVASPSPNEDALDLRALTVSASRRTIQVTIKVHDLETSTPDQGLMWRANWRQTDEVGQAYDFQLWAATSITLDGIGQSFLGERYEETSGASEDLELRGRVVGNELRMRFDRSHMLGDRLVDLWADATEGNVLGAFGILTTGADNIGHVDVHLGRC